LLRVAEEAGFDVLLTTDKNLTYQQNLRNRKIAIVALGKNRCSPHPACAPAKCECDERRTPRKLRSD
jgi:hypothetical protein